MKTNEIIAGLRKLCGQGTEYRRTVCRQAADTLEAQQKRIEELEAERDAAVIDLHDLSVCSTCVNNGVKCHVGMPVAKNDVCCGGYEWRGATDVNVGSKEVDTKPLTAFLAPIDAYKGLKRKYLVFKSDTGEMVENCFVLRPGKDPAAVEALRAYARATDNATLSADIVNWVGVGEERRWIPVTERLPEEPLQTVLVTNGSAVCVGVYSVVYDEFGVMCGRGRGIDKRFGVTHWMPLPETVKEEV